MKTKRGMSSKNRRIRRKVIEQILELVNSIDMKMDPDWLKESHRVDDQLDKISNLLKVPVNEIPSKLISIRTKINQADKEIKDLKKQLEK